MAQYNAATGVTDIVNHRAFSAFGQLLSETDPATGQAATVSSPFGYTGCYFDAATGLQWNVNRWYNPGIQRWMSQDPMGFTAGDANLYCYCGNGPATLVDPAGLAGGPPIVSLPQPANLNANPSATWFAKAVQFDANGNATAWEYPNLFTDAEHNLGYHARTNGSFFYITGPGGVIVHKCVFPDAKNNGSRDGRNMIDSVSATEYKGHVTDPGTGRVVNYYWTQNGNTDVLSIDVHDKNGKLIGTTTISPAPGTPGGIPNPSQVPLPPRPR